MKLFFLITFAIFCSHFTFGQQENRSVRGQKLTFSVTDTLMDAVQQRILSVYTAGKAKPLFTTHLEDIQKECNSETVMIGDYETTDSTLILYRYWAKAGYAPTFPYGAAQQTYTLGANGQFVLAENLLFLEFEQSDEELWNNYLTGIPNEHLLKGKEGEVFMEKVRNRLFDDWYTLTSDWNERFGNSGFGFKK